MNFDKRAAMLDLELPAPSAPAANYVPHIIVGNMLYISGQITSRNGALEFIGKVGEDFSVDEGKIAARLCGLNILSQVRHACGGTLNKIERCIRLGGFVNSTPDFKDHPKVINGASELMIELFGERGKHTRAAVGCSSLPLGVAVEVEGLFELKA